MALLPGVNRGSLRAIYEALTGGGAFSFTDTGELFITETERETNVRASYVLTGIQASAWAILVDLSDTVNWPHEETGAAHISLLNAQVDRSANSVGYMQLGVVTRVDGTSGDVTVVDIGLQSDVAIPTARGVNAAPGVGDLVVRFVHTGGGVWTGGVGVLYHTHAA